VIWAAIIVGSLGCYLLKLAGLSVPQSVLDHPVIRRIADLIPVALLAALIAVQVFGTPERTLVMDARLAGLGVALVGLLLRAPFIVVVLLAAGTAALLRALGLAA